MLRRNGKVEIADYDPVWPEQFARVASHIREVLGPVVLSLEHVGSTAVPGLAAKPVIDVNMVVRDSSQEEVYAPALISAGYMLAVREPNWFEHRMFEGHEPRTNVHVFSFGCPEVDRMRLFRDWLCHSSEDCALYMAVKRRLAAQDWSRVEDYVDAKHDVIAQIVARAKACAAASVSGDRQCPSPSTV